MRDDGDKVLAFMRGDYAFVFNFDPSRSYTDYGVLVPPGGEWRLMFDSDELRFGGFARVSPGQKYFPENAVRGDEIVQQIKLYLPSRTVLVLRRFCG